VNVIAALEARGLQVRRTSAMTFASQCPGCTGPLHVKRTCNGELPFCRAGRCSMHAVLDALKNHNEGNPA